VRGYVEEEEGSGGIRGQLSIIEDWGFTIGDWGWRTGAGGGSFPSRWSIGNAFEKICAKAGIERDVALDRCETVERLRVHSFRHDFITQTTHKLRDIRAAQRAARHRKITTTEIYEQGT
jgi:integrase